MDEHDARDEREALDALRAADPAARLTPDADRLQAALRAAGAPAGDESAPVLVRTTDELAARRRTPRWFQAVAAVAGAAVIGGAGFLAGASGVGASVADAGSDAGAAADLDEGSSTAQGHIGPLTPDGSAPSAPGSLSGLGTAEGRSSFVGYGRTVFSSSGLSSAGGSRHVYGFDAEGAVSEATARQVATALGMASTVRQEYGVWYVEDGARTLSLQPDGVGSLSYTDAAHDPWACEKLGAPDATTNDSGGGSSSSLASAEPAPLPEPACDDATGATVPKARAQVLVARFLEAVGLDASDYRVEVATSGVTTATATLEVDGSPTGLAWSFTLTDDRVQSAWGGIAPLVDLGAYGVVSPRVAVERLGDPRFGSSWGWAVATARGSAAADGAETGALEKETLPVEPSAAPAPTTPEPGDDLSWPVQHVTITSATLGSQVTWLGDGAAVLAPTYTLRSADGGEWTVIAVVDDQLDFSAR